MISAQDIREKDFEKARLNGGYDMASVDDFLDEIADDFTALQKENTVLKNKMKVLANKVEEYRVNENAINAALLSAQKLAGQIEGEAKTRAAAIISEAESQAQARIGGLDAEIARYEKRLADAKAATEKFFDAARALCNTQLRNIDAISTGATDTPAPAAKAASAKPAADAEVESAVRSIEKTVSKIKPEPQLDLDLSFAMDTKPGKNADLTQTFNL